MKKLLLSLLISVVTTANATPICKFVLPVGPGGASDTYARLVESHIKDKMSTHIEYRPGAYSTSAISFLESNKDFGMLNVPNYFGPTNPHKNPPVEVIQYFGVSQQAILTNKTDVTVEKLLTDKVTVGIAMLGGPQHLIAKQLQEKNPQVEIVPFGGDSKALPSIRNKEIDAYVGSMAGVGNWVDDFGFKNILNVPYPGVTVKDTTLNSVAIFALMVHKDATTEQRNHLLNCVGTAISSPGWDNDLRSKYITPINLTGREKDKALNNYIKLTNQYGL